MSLFGWSLPPGCGTLPGEEDEQPVDLREERTIKGYGRRQHGLNGKDSDLDTSGQLYVKEAWWFVEGGIKVVARGYASLVPADASSFEPYVLKQHPDLTDPDVIERICDEMRSVYMDHCFELVCGEGWEGEWDGDYWVLGHDIELDLELAWNDDLDDDANTAAACALVQDELHKANQEFEEAMRSFNHQMSLTAFFGEPL